MEPDDEPPHPRARRAADTLLALALLAGAALPPGRYLVQRVPDESAARENRRPAPAPELSLDLAALERFPEAFGAWYGDTFPWRGSLVRWHNAALLLGLGDAPTGDLLVGRDGWIFYRGDASLDSCRVTRPFPEDELERVAAALQSRRDWCAARDIEYRFIVAPDKHEIYPEQLPDWVRRLEPRTRLDQLVARMQGTGVEVIDPRARLLAAKELGLVYYPHGTHWAHLGAFEAYELLCESLGIEPWTPAEYERIVEVPGDTFADQLLLPDLLRQEVPGLRHRRLVYAPVEIWPAPNGQLDGVLLNSDPSLPRAVLFRDSCGNWLWPYLAQHVSRLRSESSVEWSAELVLAERASIVVEERVERHLMTPVPTALASDPEDLARSRRWLSGRPIGSGAELVLPEGVAAAMLRVEIDGAAPALLRARWIGADGAPREAAADLPAGHRFAFLELASAGPGPIELTAGADARVLATALRAL